MSALTVIAIADAIEASALALPSVYVDAATAAIVKQIRAEAASSNTARSYSSALRYWQSWFRATFGYDLTLPATPGLITRFLTDHLGRRASDGSSSVLCGLPESVDRELVRRGAKKKLGPLALKTIEHRLAVFAQAHQAARSTHPGLPSPFDDYEFKRLLADAKKLAFKRGDVSKKKTAATGHVLRAMLAQCDLQTMKGARDAAVIMVGWSSGGRRRSEIAGIEFNDLVKLPPTNNQPHRYQLNLRGGKTNQDGTRASPPKPVVGRAGEVLANWLALSGIGSGRIFREVRDGKAYGAGLSGEAVANIVKRLADAAQLEGNYAGHSLRSGWITEAGRNGTSPGDMMAFTDHRDPKTVLAYHQAGRLLDSDEATLFEKQ